MSRSPPEEAMPPQPPQQIAIDEEREDERHAECYREVPVQQTNDNGDHSRREWEQPKGNQRRVCAEEGECLRDRLAGFDRHGGDRTERSTSRDKKKAGPPSIPVLTRFDAWTRLVRRLTRR